MDIKKSNEINVNAFQQLANHDPGNNIPQSEFSKEAWSCPQCGENNHISSRYCHKCGAENNNPSGIVANVNYVEKKSQVGKLILIIFLILVLAGGAATGWYFWKESKKKKEARTYLVSESRVFGNSVALINNLSTEKELIYESKESKEVFLKKMEEERDNSGKALAEIKTSKDKNNKAFANEIISGPDALLKQYYQEAEEKIAIYNQYIAYECEVVELDIFIDKEMNKIDSVFKNSKDLKDVAKSIREMQKAMGGFLGQYKLIVPPTGLEEAHNKDVAILEKLVSSLDIVASGVEKSDLAEIKRGDEVLDEATSDKNINEIEQLRDYYFEELHGKFSDLRGRADNIKAELIKSGAVLKTEITSANIEGW